MLFDLLTSSELFTAFTSYFKKVKGRSWNLERPRNISEKFQMVAGVVMETSSRLVICNPENSELPNKTGSTRQVKAIMGSRRFRTGNQALFIVRVTVHRAVVT